jgi:hypothetical protein
MRPSPTATTPRQKRAATQATSKMLGPVPCESSARFASPVPPLESSSVSDPPPALPWWSVVGRGHASLLTNLDAGHSEPLRSIRYYTRNQPAAHTC